MEILFYTHWINNGCNYSEGVNWYQQHGSNNTLKQLFCAGENIFTRKKLREELSKLAEQAPPPKKADAEFLNSNFTRKKTPAKSTIDKNSLPDSLKKDHEKLGPIYTKMQNLHPRLELLNSDDERKDYALEILRLAQQRRGIFTRIDYFKEHGKEMPTPEKVKQEQPLPTDYFQIQHALKLLRTQRSKLKDKEHRAADYLAVCTKIDELEAKLKA